MLFVQRLDYARAGPYTCAGIPGSSAARNCRPQGATVDQGKHKDEILAERVRCYHE